MDFLGKIFINNFFYFKKQYSKETIINFGKVRV